jgi:glycosyltransferase involved in cell wall biosynthesis
MTNSEATKEDLMTTFGIHAKKIFVTYNAVINPNIQNKRDPNLIVYAGRLSENKGTSVLLDAFAKVKQRAPKLHLVLLGGTPSEVKKYMGVANELGIKDQIAFLGSRPRAEVLTQFSKASYAVVPSLSEGFGFVVIEAFSVRTPVIGSNTGGIKEIIRDDKDGLLVNPGNADDLAKAMLSMNEDLDRVLKMGESAHQRFLNTFELHRVVHQLSTYIAKKLSS